MHDSILEDDFSNYQNLESMKQVLEELKGKDFTHYSYQELRNEFHDKIGIIPALVAWFQEKNFNNYIFYRVRLNINTDVENMSMIRTYSYPPSHVCTSNGRANLKNKPVFYCSDSPITAMLETKPKIGDTGYLSVWQGNADRAIKGGIFLPEGLQASNDWSELANDIHYFAKKSYREMPYGKGIFFQELIRFISNQFLNERPPYWLTSWISNESLFGERWRDFIVYPSYTNQGYSSNLAFHPNTADQFLRFRKVIRFTIKNIVNSTWEISSGRVGEVINSEMIFRDANPGELYFFGSSRTLHQSP